MDFTLSFKQFDCYFYCNHKFLAIEWCWKEAKHMHIIQPSAKREGKRCTLQQVRMLSIEVYTYFCIHSNGTAPFSHILYTLFFQKWNLKSLFCLQKCKTFIEKYTYTHLESILSRQSFTRTAFSLVRRKKVQSTKATEFHSNTIENFDYCTFTLLPSHFYPFMFFCEIFNNKL